VDRITRICSIALTLALVAASPVAAAKDEVAVETDLFWAAQRADLLGQRDVALKNYNRLLAKLPDSAVAVDRLFNLAITHGDFQSALRGARAQQLANGGDAALPLIFFVDAWNRGDWGAAKQSVEQLKEREFFAFVTPVLDAWLAVAQGQKGAISNAALRDSGLLYYYTYDQMIFLDLANGNVDGAQRRLSGFPGFSDDYARHMAMTAAEHLGRNGYSDYANSLLQHLGVEPVSFVKEQAAFPANQALAALFSRLSEQLQEQNISEQSLFFARLAHWIAPDSVFGRMTLSNRMAEAGELDRAQLLLDAVSVTRPQWTWVVGEKVQRLSDSDNKSAALGLIEKAQVTRPESQNLKLLKARQLEQSGRFVDASALYRELIGMADGGAAKSGRRVTYRLYLAQTLSGQGQWQDAKAILEEALALNSENPEVLNLLGYTLLERRDDVARGLELVAKAHRLAPDSAAITDSLGWGHYLNGEFEKAIPLLEKAVQGAMNDVVMNEHLGDAYWQAGRAIDARYAWRSALLQADGEVAKRIAAKLDIGWTEAAAAP
jgi:Flp pilus assembly protein TadD